MIDAGPGGGRDRAVAGLASRQFGLVSRAQLLAIGMTAAMIDRAVSRGRLRPVHRGVYAVGHLALPAHAREMAAVLAVGEGAYVSHGCAAALWGMLPALDGPVEITLAGRDAGRRRPGIVVHLTPTLHPRDSALRDRIPVTSAARTLVDIAPGVGDRGLARALDRGLKGRVITRHAVQLTAGRLLHRPGARRVAELAAAELPASTETRSRNEQRFRRLVLAGGLPVAEFNVPLGDYIVDALWRDLRLVVEIDGFEFHGTRRSFEDDRERDITLGGSGWRVMRFTRDQVKRRPEWVLVQLTRELTKLQLGGAR